MGKDIINIKAGVIDDLNWVDNEGKPMLEVYVERRVKWLSPLDGVLQLNGKYEVIEGSVPEGMTDRR